MDKVGLLSRKLVFMFILSGCCFCCSKGRVLHSERAFYFGLGLFGGSGWLGSGLGGVVWCLGAGIYRGLVWMGVFYP